MACDLETFRGTCSHVSLKKGMPMKLHILLLTSLSITTLTHAADTPSNDHKPSQAAQALSENRSLAVSINTPNHQDRTALHMALYSAPNLKTEDRHKMIATLIHYGGSINTQDNLGYTPLHYAIANRRSPETVKFLLTLGADCTIKNNEHCTPLMIAVQNGFTEYLVPLLLDHISHDQKQIQQ
jgi:ankyrin repeat protein